MLLQIACELALRYVLNTSDLVVSVQFPVQSQSYPAMRSWTFRIQSLSCHPPLLLALPFLSPNACQAFTVMPVRWDQIRRHARCSFVAVSSPFQAGAMPCHAMPTDRHEFSYLKTTYLVRTGCQVNSSSYLYGMQHIGWEEPPKRPMH